MLLRAIFILTVYFVWTTSAFQCLDCSQTLDIRSSEIINTSRSECKPVNASYSSCSQLIHVRYSANTASIVFEASPSESLVLSNAAHIMTNTTMIWLDKIQFDRIFQIFCFDNACKPDAISNIYLEAQHFKYSELWAKLADRLYDDPDNPENLVCADNQDKTVPCPYGFCQLISIDSSSFSRRCVRNDSIPNPYGVILTSKTILKTEIESSVVYTCNKPMCNNLAMAKEVRDLVKARKLLTDSITTITTITTTRSITIKSSAENTEKPMISIQCGFIFLMTFVFRQ